MTLDKYYEIQKLLKSGKRLQDIPFRVVFYARVSTKSDDQRTSLDSQVLTYRRLIKECPNWEFVGEYTDRKSAKTIKARKGFQKMLDDAHAGKFDLLVVKEISRYGRDVVDSVQTARDLVALGIAIYSVIDSLTSFDDDFEERLAKLSTEAQTEISRMSRRVRMGMHTAALEKKAVLGNNAITGYRKTRAVVNGIEVPALEIVPEEAKIIRKIFELYVYKHMGFYRIQHFLYEQGITTRTGKPLTTSTLQYILTNPKYKGTYCANRQNVVDYRTNRLRKNPKEEWIMFDDTEALLVPAIVDPDLWDAANEQYLQRRSKHISPDKTLHRKTYAMTGLLICAEHGRALTHDVRYPRTPQEYEIWSCKQYRHADATKCCTPVIYQSEIHVILQEMIEHTIGNLSELIPDVLDLYKKHSKKIADPKYIRDLELEEKLCNAKLEKLVSSYLDDIIRRDIYLNQKDQLETRLTSIKLELAQAKTVDDADDSSSEIMAKVKDFLTDNLFQVTEDYDLSHALIDRVLVKSGGKQNTAILDVFLTTAPAVAITRVVRHERHTKKNTKDSEEASSESSFMTTLLNNFIASKSKIDLENQPDYNYYKHLIRSPLYHAIIGLYTGCADLSVGHIKLEFIRRGAGQENYYVFTYYVNIYLKYLMLPGTLDTQSASLEQSTT